MVEGNTANKKLKAPIATECKETRNNKPQECLHIPGPNPQAAGREEETVERVKGQNGERRRTTGDTPWAHRQTLRSGTQDSDDVFRSTTHLSTPAPVAFSSTHKLKCFYTNARSLNNKIEELRLIADDCKPDIIGITETWAHSESHINIEGYHPPLRHDRTDGRRGGGVALYISRLLKFNPCQELNEIDYTDATWCTIPLEGRDELLIGLCYRSPSSSEDNNSELLNLIRSACSKGSSHILLMGDFNLKEIHWENATVDGPQHNYANSFLEATQDQFLVQHVTGVTWRHEDRESRLDLVFTNEEHMIDKVGTGAPLGDSDHLSMTWQYVCYTKPEQHEDNPLRKNYWKGNYTELSKELAEVDWEQITVGDVHDS